MTSIGPALGATSVLTSQQYGGERLDFTVAGKRAFMILPAQASGGAARPWLWYQPTLLGPHPTDPTVNPGANTYPNDLHAWLFTQLLTQGFCIAGVETGETYGNHAGRAAQASFYDAVVSEFNLAAKACLLPQSRGGLMHYNWAVEHPERVQCIGAIYPVTDIHTWIGIDKIAQPGFRRTWISTTQLIAWRRWLSTVCQFSTSTATRTQSSLPRTTAWRLRAATVHWADR